MYTFPQAKAFEEIRKQFISNLGPKTIQITFSPLQEQTVMVALVFRVTYCHNSLVSIKIRAAVIYPLFYQIKTEIKADKSVISFIF